ncbi:MAG TPA: hypothetical protein P5142_03640, partial [Spirochaetia bacterium]|nr:hypothetical protein [Spirochaetia bacterium]
RRRGFRGRPGRQGPGGRPAQDGRQAPEGEAARRPLPIEPEPPRPEDKRELSVCPLCGRPLYDLSTALSASKEGGEPAHFDCVLERVIAAESLGPGEKIVYLGSGAFGVVEFKDRSETAFAVKRRIQWEKEGEKREWRRNLSSRITNL